MANRSEEMVDFLHNWQNLERKAINDTAEIMEKTENPLIRMVMEIIRHDSLMHHRVQQFMVDSLTKENVTLSREDIGDIWKKIEEHVRTENKAVQMAEEMKSKAWSPVHKALFDYLLRDETKHTSILQELNELKKGMSQASGG